MLLAARHGYDVMELNASDTRSKKALDEELTGAVDSTVLDFGAWPWWWHVYEVL
jgi:hypothetical protein